MDQPKPTIMNVVNLANSIRVGYLEEAGLPARSKTLVTLTSDLDVGLTVLEESIGYFKGLTPEGARKLTTLTRECDRFEYLIAGGDKF